MQLWPPWRQLFNARLLSALLLLFCSSQFEDADTKADRAVNREAAAADYRAYLDHGLDSLSKSKLTVARGKSSVGRRLARAN